jgi:hypothetical protein
MNIDNKKSAVEACTSAAEIKNKSDVSVPLSNEKVKQIINAYCKNSNLDELFDRLADLGLQSVDTAVRVLIACRYITYDEAEQMSLKGIDYGNHD